MVCCIFVMFQCKTFYSKYSIGSQQKKISNSHINVALFYQNHNIYQRFIIILKKNILTKHKSSTMKNKRMSKKVQQVTEIKEIPKAPTQVQIKVQAPLLKPQIALNINKPQISSGLGIQPQQIIQNQSNVNPFLSNAQQQQALGVQSQQVYSANLFQIPVQQSQVQMNQFPPQQVFQAPQMLNANYAQMNQTPVFNNSPQQQIRGGVYGRRQVPQKANLPDIFNDDQAIVEKVKQQKKDARIDIEIRAQRSMAKLKEEIMLPAMVSLKTQGGSRTSVDLICVIDVSGSMNGQKIQLVKSTMKYLLEALTSSDRLSIITFESWGERVCGLKCITPQNMVSLSEHINSLSARGGTNICSGLDLAVKTIKERKHANKVTSVFLLSDGQDKGAQATFRKTLQVNKNDLGVFSIHSFGFGTDHDEDLMTKICQMREGSFYFIKELATLDQAFSNALGGVISLVATDVTIKLSNIAKNIVEGVKIKKTYGEMWQMINQKQYTIKILQLMSGISKDYVFQLLIPYINTQVGDLDRDHQVLQGIFTAKGVDNLNMTGECSFKITLLNQNQEIPEVNQNIDVIENHLRVVASQAIQQNMKKAEKNQFQQAQKGIDTMINYIQSNTKARKQKMEYLVNDLQNIKQKCSSNQEYQNQGKKWMKSAQISHANQNNYAYSNVVQKCMVMEQKSKKR